MCNHANRKILVDPQQVVSWPNQLWWMRPARNVLQRFPIAVGLVISIVLVVVHLVLDFQDLVVGRGGPNDSHCFVFINVSGCCWAEHDVIRPMTFKDRAVGFGCSCFVDFQTTIHQTQVIGDLGNLDLIIAPHIETRHTLAGYVNAQSERFRFTFRTYHNTSLFDCDVSETVPLARHPSHVKQLNDTYPFQLHQCIQNDL